MAPTTKTPVTLADLSFEERNTVLTSKNGNVSHYSRVISDMRRHGLVTDVFRLGQRHALTLQQQLLAAL